MEPDHIALLLADIAQEVGDAQAAFLRLAREVEAGELRGAVLGEENEVIAVARCLEVAVGRLRGEDLLLFGPGGIALYEGRTPSSDRG